MNREIKFRGISLENPIGEKPIKKDWVFGSLFHDTRDNTFHIWDEAIKYWVKIDPETIGQFVGISDKNGKQIYEGDILEIITSREHGYRIDGESIKLAVSHRPIFMQNETMYEYSGFFAGRNRSIAWAVKFDKAVVIGNRFDNPELLEGER